MKTIDIYGNFLDKNNPFIPIIHEFVRDPRFQINLMGPVHRSLLHIQRRKYIKGSIAFGFGMPREFAGMHMGSYDLKLGYISWETTRVPYGSFYGLKETLQKLDLILIPNEWQQLLFEHVGAYMRVFPMAAGLPYIGPHDKSEDPYTFICTGKLTHKTNVGYLVSAVMALSQKYDVQLILKTEGGTLGHLQFPEKNIQIIDGEISQLELISLYKKANCFIYPTSADALPVELFNAIQMGLRIIGPTHSGFDEQNDLRKHTLIPAERYSKKLGDVGSYWSVDYEELLQVMENSINGVNPYYGSGTDFQTTQEFVDGIYKLVKSL